MKFGGGHTLQQSVWNVENNCTLRAHFTTHVSQIRTLRSLEYTGTWIEVQLLRACKPTFVTWIVYISGSYILVYISTNNQKFLFFSSHLLSSLSLLAVTQIRGHMAGSSLPLPTTVRALHFYSEKISALSSFIDSRRKLKTVLYLFLAF